jgi:hypothetical protein
MCVQSVKIEVAEALAEPPLRWSVGVTDYRLETYIASTKSRRRRKQGKAIARENSKAEKTKEEDATVTPGRKRKQKEKKTPSSTRTAGRTAGDDSELMIDKEEDSEDLGTQQKKRKGEKKYVTYGDGEYVYLVDGANEKVAEMKVKTGQPPPPEKDHPNYTKSTVPGAYVLISGGNKFKILSKELEFPRTGGHIYDSEWNDLESSEDEDDDANVTMQELEGMKTFILAGEYLKRYTENDGEESEEVLEVEDDDDDEDDEEENEDLEEDPEEEESNKGKRGTRQTKTKTHNKKQKKSTNSNEQKKIDSVFRAKNTGTTTRSSKRGKGKKNKR